MVKLIYKPSYYVVGEQNFNASELNQFLEDHGWEWSSTSDVPAEVLTETAGRLCYLSYNSPRPGGNRAYLKHILESQHGSVVEHAVWNLIVCGVSRSLSHELIRHRAGVSVSQLSQRYVDESDVAFVVPPDLVEDVKAGNAPGKVWLDNVSRALDDYKTLANHLEHKAMSLSMTKTERRKYARQAARSVLPNAAETMLFLTMNARAIRNIIEQRSSAHADPEIRRFANMLHEFAISSSEHLFGDYVTRQLDDGTNELTTPWRKV